MGSDHVLLEPLIRIASMKRGGVVVHGEPTGDRDTVIGLAREALVSYTGARNVDAAIEQAKRLVIEKENA